jgi:hypothetical protein
MKNLIFVFACLMSLSCFGQGWEHTYGGPYDESSFSVQQTTDGDYVICGYAASAKIGNRYVYLFKINVNGATQWSQTYGSANGLGASVQQTTDGGYIIVGGTGSGASDYDVYLIKTDGNGIEQWSQTYGGTEYDTGYSVQQTTDGGYIITGYTETSFFPDSSNKIYLIKTDGNGVEQWSHTFSGPVDVLGQSGQGPSMGWSVQQTSDGGYIITGYTEEYSNKIYLIKTDGNGVEQWSQTYGGDDAWSVGKSVQQTTDGGYIITGYTEYFTKDDLSYSYVYLIKTDGNGVEQWSHTFSGPVNAWGQSVQQTTDGGYIIVGGATTSETDYRYSDVYLIKTTENGGEQWSQTYGGIEPDYEFGRSVQQTTDGGYIIAGRTISGENTDIYLIKTDSEGTLSSSFTIPTPSNRKLEKVVDVLGREVNHTTNQILFHIYDDGSVEKKFVVD